MTSQLFRYILVGLINSALGYSLIFTFMLVFGFGSVLSNFLGYSIALLISFVLNKNFTFKSTEKSNSEFILFLVSFGIAYSANLIALIILIEYFDVNEYAAQIISGIIYVGSSFLMNKYFVFKA